MTWAVSSLDPYAIISNSDAHSAEKLGREATLLDMEASFEGLSQALSNPAKHVRSAGAQGELLGTIEFFPQEGKYFFDGHRGCAVSFSPEESQALNGICPICKKPLTSGVLGRVRQLADRVLDEKAPYSEMSAGSNRRPYYSLVSLQEIIGELLEKNPESQAVRRVCNSLILQAGGELPLLLSLSISAIQNLKSPAISGELLALTIERIRKGEVSIVPGFDGLYGKVRVDSGVRFC